MKGYKVVETEANGNEKKTGANQNLLGIKYYLGYLTDDKTEVENYIVSDKSETVTIENKIPERRVLQVTKRLLDKYGEEIAPESGQSFYFKLYKWWSQYNKEAIKIGDTENHKITYNTEKGEWNIVEFENLPEPNGFKYVIKETDSIGNELGSDQYLISYRDNSGTVNEANGISVSSNNKVTITNKPTDSEGKLQVKKVWKDANGAILSGDTLNDKTATVQLWRNKKAVSGSGNATITLTAVNNGPYTITNYSSDLSQIQVGDSVEIHFGVNGYFVDNSLTINGVSAKVTNDDNGNKVVSFLVDSTEILIQYTGNRGYNAPVVINKTESGQFPKLVDTVTLTGNGSAQWDLSTKVGPNFADYDYYFVEVEPSTGYNISYSVAFDGEENRSGNVSAGTVTVSNQLGEQTGSLKLTKVVQVDDQIPNTAAEKNLVNGDYVFTVSKDNSIIKYVQITVADGAPASYKVADKQEELKSTTPVEETPAIVSGLEEGDYVEECGSW